MGRASPGCMAEVVDREVGAEKTRPLPPAQDCRPLVLDCECREDEKQSAVRSILKRLQQRERTGVPQNMSCQIGPNTLVEMSAIPSVKRCVLASPTKTLGDTTLDP